MVERSLPRVCKLLRVVASVVASLFFLPLPNQRSKTLIAFIRTGGPSWWTVGIIVGWTWSIVLERRRVSARRESFVLVSCSVRGMKLVSLLLVITPSFVSVRDAISRDPMHHSFTWDLSQNVTRAPFRTSTVGVSGCVTPGGELLLPHRGRTMMGYEKLLLQGKELQTGL